MNRQQLIDDPNSPLNTAKPDEPLFLLKAHDQLSVKSVRDWGCRLLELAEQTQKTDPALAALQRQKASNAFEDAGKMEAWQALNGKKIPD